MQPESCLMPLPFKPAMLDEFYFLGKNLFSAIKTGHPTQFLKEQNMGFLGGGARAGVMRIAENPRNLRNWARAPISAFKGGAKDLARAPKLGWEWSYGALWPVMMGLSAYNASKAPAGQKMGTFAGNAAGDMIGAAAGAMLFGAPGAFIGNVFFGSRIGEAITSTINNAQAYNQRARTLEMGTFHDTNAARTMRQVAAREMSGSLLNARQFLGQEAAAFHM